MHCNEYTLPNGLRIIHEPTLSKVAYCGSVSYTHLTLPTIA